MAGVRPAVGLDRDGSFVEVLVPVKADPCLPTFRRPAALGARAPVQRAAADWLRTTLDLLERGRVVATDYMSETAAMAARPWREWLRTYRGHDRGEHPLRRPGSQDITCEVALDQLTALEQPATVRSQAQFLALHGIDDLVAEGRARRGPSGPTWAIWPPCGPAAGSGSRGADRPDWPRRFHGGRVGPPIV